MPNARQTSLIASPSSSRATNRRRSSITEHSFHGIQASTERGKVLPMCPVRSVTYVSGRSQERTGTPARAGASATLISRPRCRTRLHGPAGCGLRMLARRKRSDAFVFRGDVLVGVVRQQRRRSDADDPAEKDIEGDRQARVIGGEQCRRDKRRGATRNDRGELVAERGAAVTQPTGEAFRDQRRLGP